MNTLTTQRGALQAALVESGLTVKDHLPERIVPPVAVIAAGSPYLESGETFGSWTVRFTVVLVCAQGTNETATKDLDDAVTAVVVALDGAGWALERVDQPTMLQHGNGHFLSTTVDVRARVPGIEDGRPS